MTQKEFDTQSTEYQWDLYFYDAEANEAIKILDPVLFNDCYKKIEDIKNQLEELEEQYPEYII